MKVIVVLGFWLLCGVLSVFVWAFHDLRGEKYRADYIDEDVAMAYLLVLIGGPVSLLSLFRLVLASFIEFLVYNGSVTKFLYRIANIGLKKEDGEDESTTD